jgi:hypothetical protein
MCISAKVNVAISQIATVSTGLLFSPLILRILLGPFHLFVVIGVYYTYKAILTVIITLLILKTALMTAFLRDFNTMTGTT